ncbi:MAG: ribosomal protein S18-alanine N-acetyltransferase [Oscillospiraceae bacterium]|nr:ribosomal protein S18-alanine N-acetyltransferase [Oscillospiraceae bacterium]
MCGVRIRGLERADIPALALLERENFSDPWSASAFESELSNPYGVTLVAEREGEILGYLSSHLICENLHINTFCVREKDRGKGVASSLLAALLNLAASTGAESATLEARQSNTPALSLYQKFGFSPVGLRKRFYQAPAEDAVLMKKELHSDEDTRN